MSLFAASLLLLAGETGQRTIDNWVVYDGADIDRESMIFIDRSGLYQRPDGWINFSFQEVRNGSRLNTVKSRVMGTWVNCKTHQYINDYRMEYGTDGKMLQEGKLDEQRRVPAPGSAEARVLAFACGDTSGAVRIPLGTNLIVAANDLYTRNHPGTAGGVAPRTTAAAAPAPRTNSSGSSADYWYVYPTITDQVTGISDGNDDVMAINLFVVKSTVQRRPDGWILFDYIDVRNGLEAKAFKWRRFSTRTNCMTRQFADERLEVHKTIGASPEAFRVSGPPRAVETGSFQDILLTFVCGETGEAHQLPRGADPVAYADKRYAEDHAPAAKAPRTPAAASPAPRATQAPARPAVAAPGLGKASWRILTLKKERMVIFAPLSVRRGRGTGQAWFTTAYPKPTTTGGVNGVATTQILYTANCAGNTITAMQGVFYDDDERVLGSEVVANPQPISVPAGSIGQLELGILCGRPVELWSSDPYDQEVLFMWDFYRSVLDMAG